VVLQLLQHNSLKLILEYVSGFDSGYVTLKTNKTIANHMKHIYSRNHCWTWYDDWEWFNEESFTKDKDHAAEIKNYGHIFSSNMIKFNYPDIQDGTTLRQNSATAQLRRQNTQEVWIKRKEYSQTVAQSLLRSTRH
jgi:hypothetical protein